MGYILRNDGVTTMNGMSLDCFFRVSATNTAHPKIDIKHQKYELINPFEFWAPKLRIFVIPSVMQPILKATGVAMPLPWVR